MQAPSGCRRVRYVVQSPLCCKDTINLHAAAAQGTRYRCDAVAGGFLRQHCRPIDSAATAEVPPFGFRSFDAFALTFFDKAPLHLSDHAEHGNNNVAYFAARRYVRIKHGDRRPALFTLMDQVQHIACVAAQAIPFVPFPGNPAYGGF